MKKSGEKVLFSILTLTLIFHTSMTISYNFPLTPLKYKYENFISSYMNPLFQQTWTLFAPNPSNTNNNLQFRIEYKKANKNLETDWISLSDKFISQTKKKLFSSLWPLYWHTSPA
ncbi:DUF5819 family protein [Rossellomorea marisflavi]|uniref:DUF5819 family protein n=1 Tax=Rossellomorea marisflavi TaxID=189381 RepID=UPI00203C4EC5|nr:DUF5819 family protein [Rossellomorea marisflavi]MCM2588075.1 DUF5819 family protein [Rossellomorea marisflavi]